MSQEAGWISGEFKRTFDDKHRLTLPTKKDCNWVELIASKRRECVLAKEREGCLSLWNKDIWELRFGERIAQNIESLVGNLHREFVPQDMAKIQRFARLCSTRSDKIPLEKSQTQTRFIIPEGFREFLDVESGSEVIMVGAGVCIEIWKPEIWISYLRQDIGEFHSIFKELTT